MKTEREILTNILQIRQYKRFTQKELGEYLGITEASYNRIESGKIALSYQHLTKIASFFKMSVVDVITYPETYAPSKSSANTKVVVEFDVSCDEFVKMGLKDKIVQVLNIKNNL